MIAFVRRTAIWIPVIVIALLMLPMVVTNRSFGHDWTLHLWMVREQQRNIQAMGHPGLFVSADPLGAFYPVYAFVGTGMYTVGGYLAIVLGDRPILAYKLLYLFGLTMAYGGMTWLSIQTSLRGWRSQIPGLVFVTGAYFLTDMVGRGDFGEFVAVASIPLVVAASYKILGGGAANPMPRTRDLLALVLGAFVLTGSHTITLLWGSVFLILLALLALLSSGRSWPRPLPWGRVAAWIVGVGLGGGLNAWFLLPNVRYGLDTVIAHTNRGLRPLTILESPGLLLNPLRPSDIAHSTNDIDIRVALPWLFVAWAIAIAFLAWRRADRPARRMFGGLCVLGAGYFTLAVAKSPWRLLPHIFYNIQFTWRLHAYLLLLSALACVIAVRWHSELRGRTRVIAGATLAVIVLFTVGAATWQVWRVRSEYHVVGVGSVAAGSSFNDDVVAARTQAPPSWYEKGSFRDDSAPRVPSSGTRMLTVPVAAVHGSTFSGVLAVPDGPAPFRTNIAGGPKFVTMTGIRAVGQTRRGLVVAVRSRAAPATGPIAVTIRQRGSTVLRAGAFVSIVSALLVLALIVWPVVRRLRDAQPSTRSASRPR